MPKVSHGEGPMAADYLIPEEAGSRNNTTTTSMNADAKLPSPFDIAHDRPVASNNFRRY